MDKLNEQGKKCFCARCFLPIDTEDRVDIEGQNFHKICSMCCVCRTIPTSLKMFYGHVFCGDCFKGNVMARFRGDLSRMHSNSWWLWGSGSNSQDGRENYCDESRAAETADGNAKRCICARCLQVVGDDKVDIAGQSFHAKCSKCYFCHAAPTTHPKIYYGQMFCEPCFHRHVLGPNRDNPTEFFKNCFEQWQNNPQFADRMREFMGGSSNTPFIFMMQGQQPPFCRCATNPQDPTFHEPKKSATPTLSMCGDSVATWDLSCENRTEVSEVSDSCTNRVEGAAEKIEKLTKYLHERKRIGKSLGSPKCVWQWGPIYIDDSIKF